VSDPPVEFEDPEVDGALPAATVAVAAAARERLRRTDRDIVGLAWPAILSQALASAVLLVDLGMVGHLGTRALAAVGYATQFYFLAQAVLMALGAGCVALMARAAGAGQPALARSALATFLALGGALAAGLAALTLAAPGALLAAIHAPPEIAELATPYLQLTLCSSVLLSVSVAHESGYRAARNTRLPLAVAGLVTAVKLGLNALLIFGLAGLPRLELAGAGWATLVSQLVGVIAFTASARRAAEPEAASMRLGVEDLRAVRGRLGEALRVAGPAAGERALMQAALVAYFWFLGGYGPAVIAAYTVGMRLLSFSWIPGIGYSVAAATLVGQAMGAADRRAARDAARRAVRLALLTSLGLGALFAVARGPLVGLFTDDPAVIRAIGPFMWVLALAQPVIAANFTLAGALRGAGDTVSPLVATFLGTWGIRLPLGLLLAQVLHTEVVWVYAVLALDHAGRFALVGLRFRQGAWARAVGVSTR
jgi:putative MATE family efflux protein